MTMQPTPARGRSLPNSSTPPSRRSPRLQQLLRQQTTGSRWKLLQQLPLLDSCALRHKWCPWCSVAAIGTCRYHCRWRMHDSSTRPEPTRPSLVRRIVCMRTNASSRNDWWARRPALVGVWLLCRGSPVRDMNHVTLPVPPAPGNSGVDQTYGAERRGELLITAV